jgi:hypothetical protein
MNGIMPPPKAFGKMTVYANYTAILKDMIGVSYYSIILFINLLKLVGSIPK